MANHPPPHLIELLERTGLATRAQVHQQARRVARLARGLPCFDSLWLDALVQARCLTPYQAAEIGAGRAEELRVGPFVCCRPLVWPQYVRAFQARRVSDGRAALLVILDRLNHPKQDLLGQLRQLADRALQLRSEHLAPIAEVGREADRLWAAADWIEGVSAARLLTHHGRFESEAALEISRQIVAGLAVVERAGLCHGDVCAAGLMLDRNGRVVLPLPGLRPIVRPEEGYGRADLAPEAFDYLAPERIARGTPPDRTSDIYACGCLWWHLLTGRAPLGGGDSLGKLRAAQEAAIPDVRRLAPAAPEALAAAVAACLARERADRPGSMAELAAMLGNPTARGAVVVARQAYRRRSGLAVRWHKRVSQVRRNGTGPFWMAVAAGCLLAAGAALWGGWNRGAVSALGPASGPATTAQSGTRLPTDSDSLTRAGQNALAPPRASTRPNGAQPEARAAMRPHAPAAMPGDTGTRVAGLGRTAPPGGQILAAEYRREVDTPSAKPGLPDSAVPRSGSAGSDPHEVVLCSAGGALRLESLDLQPGQHLRGEGPGRPVVLVPRGGLVVSAEDVRFDNLAFCWQAPAATEAGPGLESQGPEGLVELRCARAEFRNCTFSVPGAATPRGPAALVWHWPAPSAGGPVGEQRAGLPTGRLRLENCVLSQVSAGVQCQPAAALALEIDNVLHVAPGPLLRLDGGPGADQPLLIRARRLTLRDSGPLVEVDCTGEGPGGSIGPLRIEASASVFAPRAGAPLILLLTRSLEPETLTRALWWNGQGSLVAEGVAVAAWGPVREGVEPLDEAGLAIAGLVRSRVEFAGASLDDPSHSRVTGWQAPLTGPLAPGFDPADLVVSGSGAF